MRDGTSWLALITHQSLSIILHTTPALHFDLKKEERTYCCCQRLKMIKLPVMYALLLIVILLPWQTHSCEFIESGCSGACPQGEQCGGTGTYCNCERFGFNLKSSNQKKFYKFQSVRQDLFYFKVIFTKKEIPLPTTEQQGSNIKKELIHYFHILCYI